MKTCPECHNTYESGEQFCPIDGARLPGDSESPVEEPADPLVGQVLADRYLVKRVIGAGGMGVVYEAEHTVIGKHVAVKVLRGEVSEKPDVLERFKQEAKSASRIGHENIIDISDFGETSDGASFLVMEMLEGHDLSQRLEEVGTLSVPAAISVLVQCCKALGAAHDKGIIHRDMKPENIFLVPKDDGSDFVKIVDFGIAKMSDLETPGAPGRKLTKTGMIFGTPEYMSPEQAYGRPTDHRVDIYAMGIIAFEVFAGRVPFMGDSFMAILSQHMLEPPKLIREFNPQAICPPALEAVIYRCLEKDPDARPQTMRELADELLAAVGASGVHAFPHGASGSLAGIPGPSGHYRAQTPASIPPSPSQFPADGGSGPRTGVTTPSSRPGGTAIYQSGPQAVPSLSDMPPPSEQKSKVGPLVFVAVILLSGVGIGGYFYATADGRVPQPPPRLVVDAGPAAVAVVDETPDAGSEEPPPVEEEDAGVEMSELFINSDPSRAEVYIVSDVEGEEDEQVCASTPCFARVVRGQEVTFSARRGRLVGETTFTAAAEREAIEIRLRRVGTTPGTTPDTTMTGGDMSNDTTTIMMQLQTPDLMIPPELR